MSNIKPEQFTLNTRVIAIGEESNDIYMSLDMVFLTSEVNLNSVQFLEDFIYGVETEKDRYVGLPLVADITNLENGKYSKLTHLYKNGKFGTTAIGSFVDFSTRQNGDVLELLATARVWKRNVKTCAALAELFASNEGLQFSYEVYSGNYTVDNGVKKIGKHDDNAIIGSCVVSFPAVKASKCETLIAEAILADKLDQEINQGGENVVSTIIRDENRTLEDIFASTKTYLSAELDLSQIRRKIYQQLKVIYKDRWYYYDVINMFMDYIVVQDYETGDYTKHTFIISNGEVALSEGIPVEITFVEKTNKEVQTAMEEKILELEAQLATANTTIATLNTEVAESKATITAKETEIASLNAQIVEVGEQLTAKEAEIATLVPYKEQIETAESARVEAELAAKKTALKEKCEKILTAEEVLELAEAIEALDENKINAVLASKYVAVAEAVKKTPKPEKTMITATRVVDEIKLEGNSVVSKYITIQ